jgi:cAMP phosphodiesterase
MRLRILGCSGAEFPGNNSPSFLLDDEIVFDAGSITKVLDEKAQLKIRNIFLTHAHLDHIGSIPFLADNIIMSKNWVKVNIMSTSPVIRAMKKHLFNSSLWPDFTIIPHPDNAVLNLIQLKISKPVTLKGHTVTPYRVNHIVPAVGYLVEDAKKKSFFYTGDTGPCTETWKKIGQRKLDFIIIEVSFPNAMRETALKTGHLTPQLLKDELLKIRNLPERIFVAHIKPQYINKIEAELERFNIRNLRLLRDNDIIET